MASSTIDIQQKLNDLLADADKIVENLSKQYRDQVDLLGRLTMAVKGMVEALDPSKVSGLSEEFKKAAEAADNAKTKIEGAMTSAADETEKATGANKDLNKSVKDTTQSLNEMEGSISIIGGIGKAFSFIASSGMSALSVIGSIAGALFDFAKAVILFPYKILMGLIGMASQGGSSELAEAINNIRKEFGYLNKGAGKTIMDLSKSMKGPLASTGLSVWRTFGNLAERIKYFTEYAKNLGETVDAVFANLKAGSAEVLGAFNKALGFSAAGQKAIAQRSIATGVDINELNRQIANFSVQLSDRFGVTMKAVSHDVGEMMADFEHFGNLSVQELTQSAVFARKLGIEVKSLGKLVDKFLNFEDAANSAAQLSQAFGMNVDAFKLMQEQDPGKKLQMLRDSFFAAGRSIENATAQERRLLATQSGLSESELALAFSQKSRSMTYDQIKKSGDSAQKSQLSQTEVLKKLAGAIDRIIKSGSAMQGGFFDRFVQGFTEGVRWSSEFRRMLRDLSRSLWVVQSAGRAVGRMFVQTFPGVLDMIRGFRQIFNPRQFRALMNKVKDAFKEFFLALTTNPSTAVSTFLDKIQAAFTDRLTAAGPGGRKFLDGLKSFFKAIIVIASSLLKIAMEAITKGAIYIFELLTGKRKLDVQMPDDGGFMREAFKPLVSVIFTYGPPLLEALKNLFGKIFDDLGNYLKTTVIPAVKEFLLTYIVQGILLYVLASGIVSGLGAVIRMIGAALFNPATIAAATTSAVGLEGFLLALRMIQLKDVARAGGIMVALAAAIGLGGVAMAMAIWGMSKILANVGTENILKSLLVLSLTVGNMILVAYATKALKTEDIVQAGIIMFLTSIALLKSGLALIISGAILASALKSSGAGVSDIAAALLVLSLTVGNMILVIYATKKLKPDNIVQAGITMFLTSIALLKSGLALIISGAVLARALKSSGASVSDIAVAMLALTGIIFNTIILVGALKIISKMISGDLLKGLPIIGLVLVGMIAVTYLAVRAFKGLKADEIKAISEAISSITYFIVAAGVVIAEALAIGAILTALGPFSAVILTGFAAIGVVVTAMIASIKVVISEIKELQLGSGFKEKLDAFISVFNAVSNFLDKFSTIASALSPGFFSSFFGRTNNLNDNLKQLTTFVEKLIGNRDGGGIIGLVRTIVESIRNITDADIKRGQEVVKIIEGFSTLIKSIVPSTDMLAHLDADDISRTLDSMGMLAINLKNAFKDLITKISSFIREVAEMNIGEGQARAITAVSTLLGALGSIITALTPSPELVKVLQRPTGSIIQGLDPVKLMQYREFIVQLYGAVGPLITSFGTFVSSLGGINFGSANEHTVNMFKAIGEIFSGFSAMLSGLMSAMSGAISRVDPARVGGMITLIIGRLGEFMSKVRQELPGLVTDMVTGFNNLQLTPAQGQLIRVKAKALEVIFGVIKNIGETIDSLSGGATFNGNQIFRKVLGMAHAMQWVYDPRHEVGNSIRVFIQRLTGNGPDDIKIPDNLKDRASKLKSLFEAIKVIGEAVGAGGEVNASALTNFGALIGKLFNPQDPIGAVLRNTITNLATFPDSSRATQKARSLGTLFNSIKVISDALGEISGGPSIEDINGTFFRLNESMKPGSQFNFFVQSLMGEGPYAGNRLTTVPEEQLRRTVGAVSSMVRLVNEVSTALGNLSDVNISSNLTRLSTNLGLGNNSTFTIQNRNFTVNVNVDVHVDAKELENTLINRTGTRISHTPG